ncbi:MAG: hypothetical protein AAFW73_26530 [Bacteroidota bacterium]
MTGAYRLEDGSKVTLGLGWLMTGDKIDVNLGEFPPVTLDRIELAYSYNYAVLPLGFIYNFGPIFVHPEVGLGFNFANRVRRKDFLTNGDVFREVEEYDPSFPTFNRWTIPAFLTLGYEIPLKQSALLVGLKGYYSLNRLFEEERRKDRYLGLGLLVGYRI